MTPEQRKVKAEYLRAWKIDNKDRVKVYGKTYNLKHKDSITSYSKKYYYANKEKRLEQHRIWNKSEKGRMCIKASDHRRRLKEMGLTVEIIQQVYENNIKRHGCLTCYLCLEHIDFGSDSLDHKTPLTRGGTNEIGNLDITHRGCNSRKHTKTESEYRAAFPLEQSNQAVAIF